MYALVLLAAQAPNPYVESKDFPRAKQEAALAATAGIFIPTSRMEGTAVIVKHADSRITLLTAGHNVPVKDGIEVELELYTPKSYPNVHAKLRGFVKARMPNEDLAVVVAECKEAPGVLSICPKAKLPIPELFPFPALTVGCDDVMGKPKCEADLVVGKQYITKPDRTAAQFWETQRAQAVGRSGGPLVDSRGYLMGICSGIKNKKGYYTYISEIHKALDNAGFRDLYLEDRKDQPAAPKSR